MSDNTMMTKYDPGQFNVLLPSQTVTQVGPWHSIRTSEVKVDPNSENGDVFKVGSRGYGEHQEDVLCLAKPALNRIASAAGISWNWRECGLEGPATRDYVCYKAVAGIRLADGTWQPLVASKEIDITVIEEELREQYTKKANTSQPGEKDSYKGTWKKETSTSKNGKEYEKNAYYLDDSEKARYIENKTRADLIQWRKNKRARAETGAMNRVIRMALGLKSQYTATELARPFIIPRIDFTPDWNNPAVRQALIEHGVSNMTTLFGQSSCAAPAINGPSIPERPAIAAPSDYDDDFISGDVHEITNDRPVTKDPTPVINISGQQEKAETAAQAGKTESASQGTAATSSVTTSDIICVDCKREIKQNVADYAVKAYNRPLCYSCQDKAKAAKGAAA